MKKTKIRAKVIGQPQTSAIIVDQDQADRVARGLEIALSAATPVDTGRAAAGWTINDLSDTNIRVNNVVDYVQYLNEGSSKQAPARYVEMTVDAVRVLTRGNTGRLIHATRNKKPGWKYGENGFVYTYDPTKRGSELSAKKRAMTTGTNIKNTIKTLGAAAAAAAITMTASERKQKEENK